MYTVFEVPTDAAQHIEQMGTKYKFWYSDDDLGNVLFKEGRPETGEDWAEKISCELARLINLPHAQYELARYRGRRGVISYNMVPKEMRLIHGNEILAKPLIGERVSEVSTTSINKREHTISRVLSYFKAAEKEKNIAAPYCYGFHQLENISTALDVFIGYLMFDAWIANQDRHDENWSILKALTGKVFLAPSYDHGSSLGRNETDDNRRIILSTKDTGRHISKYVTKARSALFPDSTKGSKALFTLDAFCQMAKHSQDAANSWRKQLEHIEQESIDLIIAKIPQELMSDTTRDFTREILKLNKERILECRL